MKWADVIIGLSLCVLTVAASGEEAASLLGIDATLSFEYQDLEPELSPGAEDVMLIAPTDPIFGEAGQGWWFNGSAGVAIAGENIDTKIDLAATTFIADDFEFLFGVGGWYFAQEGQDALGINPTFAFRWHFLESKVQTPQPRWTVYAEAGIGLLFATDDVPDGGTPIDFTPRAGLGFTHQLGDSAMRLDLGVRWHHISNASVLGTDDNPSRDSIMLYGGIIVPF